MVILGHSFYSHFLANKG